MGTEGYLADVALPPDTRLLTFVREPISLVRSMFFHCKRYHSSSISFAEWPLMVEANDANASRVCDGDWMWPLNFQTALLGMRQEGIFRPAANPPKKSATRMIINKFTLERALAVLDRAYWVGVTDHYDASICLLRSQLSNSPACSCETANAMRISAAPNAFVSAHHGSAPPDIEEATRASISRITLFDSRVYQRAAGRFRRGLEGFGLRCLLEREQ
jgi:hypothetical protein